MLHESQAPTHSSSIGAANHDRSSGISRPAASPIQKLEDETALENASSQLSGKPVLTSHSFPAPPADNNQSSSATSITPFQLKYNKAPAADNRSPDRHLQQNTWQVVQRVTETDLTEEEWALVNSPAFMKFAQQRKYAGKGPSYKRPWLANRSVIAIRKDIAEFNGQQQALPLQPIAPPPQQALPLQPIAPPPQQALPPQQAILPPQHALPPQQVAPAPLAQQQAPNPFDALIASRKNLTGSDLTYIKKAHIAATKAVGILSALHPPLVGGFFLGGSYAAFLAGNNKIPGDVDIDVKGEDPLDKATKALISGGFSKGPGSASSGMVNKVILPVKYKDLNPESTKPENTINATVEVANIEALNVNSKTKPAFVHEPDASGVHPNVNVTTAVNMILNWLQRIKEDKQKASDKHDFESIRKIARTKPVTAEMLRAAYKAPVSEEQITLFNRLKGNESLSEIKA